MKIKLYTLGNLPCKGEGDLTLRWREARVEKAVVRENMAWELYLVARVELVV